ncbi:unnamed protein product [Adineta steineri]|uniref:Uncharacterized protein n=1 Tax=Adineta steineri TaxID=433720 RepID=A0A815M4K8_9BILA|nr:unnamed protein product [Adineta steineri]
MRSERMLKFSLEFPEESQEERFFVMFHNVQSLNKHIFDVRSDKTFLSASMISLVETWTKPSDCLEIEGFKIIHRRDCNDIQKPFVEPVVRQINTRSTNFKVERKQFPLVPCEAMTIYKSQGATYEKVVVNLKKGMTRSELYVACSRATKSIGLYLNGDFVPPKPPEPKDAVAMMFKNMRSERMLKFSLEFPEESQEERSDKTFLSASMISLVETWTKPSDSLEIEGFKIIHRRDCNDIRKPFGQITYLKNDLKYENITEKYEYSGKNHIEYSSIKIDDICIISVYNSPNSSFDVLKRHMNEAITISKGFCENIIVVGLKSDYFESLTSFHKPIWIRKHEVLSKFHFDETEDIHTNTFFNIDDAIIDDQSDVMEVDEEFSFDHHETVDKNEQIDLDMSFQLEDLKVNDPSDMMEIEEQSFSEDYTIIDSKSRKILNHFLCALEFDNITDSNQISS